MVLQALNALEDLLLQRPSTDELLEATRGLCEEDVQQLFGRFFGSGCLIEGLIMGNLDWADAIELQDVLLRPFKELRSEMRVPAPVERLLRGEGLTILQLDGTNENDANSCAVENLCNVAPATVENEALAALAMQFWRSSFYNELRSRQQLGYVVSSFMRIRVTHISFVFLVQTERAPEIALRSMEKFLHAAFHEIYSLNETTRLVFKDLFSCLFYVILWHTYIHICKYIAFNSPGKLSSEVQRAVPMPGGPAGRSPLESLGVFEPPLALHPGSQLRFRQPQRAGGSTRARLRNARGAVLKELQPAAASGLRPTGLENDVSFMG